MSTDEIRSINGLELTLIPTADPLEAHPIDECGPPSRTVPPNSPARRACFLLVYLLLFVGFFIVQVVILITLRFEIGFSVNGSGGWFFLSMLSFATTSTLFILPVLAFLRKLPTLTKKAMALAALAVLLDVIVFQVALSVAVPAVSLLPLSTFSTDLTNMDCTREATQEVREFFAAMSGGSGGEVLDFNNVVIVYGGLSRWFTGVAMVVDEAVHLPVAGCRAVSASLFSHEL
eukprot:CAMPEP_0182460274 /NCGR_PEP_ID=MMETSP1319-20130603/5186_1 /TAXON_ID=172717 /ORGANISM="Bolidomonas pacifica, Strain RCC208" /LENGTH=231 /DNA_ID=CAMNT_0024659345 /DNA_START=168 /DNA_END=859 /DNA_ORIENTATION=-